MIDLYSIFLLSVNLDLATHCPYRCDRVVQNVEVFTICLEVTWAFQPCAYSVENINNFTAEHNFLLSDYI